MDSDQHDVQDVVDRLLPDHEPIVRSEYLPSGYSNRNFRIQIGSRVVVLRICRRKPQDVDAELKYLSLPCVPPLVAYDQEAGHMITEYVPADHLVQRPFSVKESSQYLRDLHEQIPMGIKLHDPVAKALSHFEKADVQNDLRSYLEQSSWAPSSIHGCHNDLNPHNVLRVNDKCLTLDWEFAGDNDHIFDLVNLCYGMEYSDADTETCAKDYLDAEYDGAFLLETRIIFQIREHGWAIEQIAAGNDRKEIRRQARITEAEFRRLISIQPHQ